MIERFASLGTEPVPQAQATPDALKSHLAAEVPRWGAVIKAAGVKATETRRRVQASTALARTDSRLEKST